MRNLLVFAGLSLAACGGTVALGAAPDSDEPGNDAGPLDATRKPDVDAGLGDRVSGDPIDAATIPAAGCGSAKTYNENFENGQLPGDMGAANPVYLTPDTTNPIDGTTSLRLSPPPTGYSYLAVDESTGPCSLTVSFKLRPSADAVASGTNLLQVNAATAAGGRIPSRTVIIQVSPGGSVAVSQTEYDSTAASMGAATASAGQLVANQVATVSVTVNLGTSAISLTVDGQTATTSLLGADKTPGLQILGVGIGTTPELPAGKGTFWIDDLVID